MTAKKPRTQNEIVEKYNWRKVSAPKSWRPERGESIVGYFAGMATRHGANGNYDVVFIAVPGDGMRMMTGVRIIELVRAAFLSPGDPIRVIFDGTETTSNGREMKQFTLYVSYGEKAKAEDLPTVEEQH